MHFYRTELPKYNVDLTGEDKLHFYRTELPKDNVDLTGEDKLHFYRTELPEDYVDLTGDDKLHFYSRTPQADLPEDSRSYRRGKIAFLQNRTPRRYM